MTICLTARERAASTLIAGAAAVMSPSMPGRPMPGRRWMGASALACAAALVATPAFALVPAFTSFTVASQSDWDAAAAGVAAASSGDQITIFFSSGVTLSSSMAALQASSTGVVVNIDGGGEVIDGASSYQGIVVSGANGLVVNISDLAITNTVATGGTGQNGQDGYFSAGLSYGSGGGGGGGLGAGGGLLVGSGATVVLRSVTFDSNSAVGGTGGSGGSAQNTAADPVNGGDGGAGGTLNGAAGAGGAGGTGGNAGTQGTAGSAGATLGDGGGGGGGSGTTSSTSYTSNNAGGAGNASGGTGGTGGDGVTNNGGSGGPGADGGFGGAGGAGQGGTLTILDTGISGATVAGGSGGASGVGAGPSSFNGSAGASGIASGQAIYLNAATANIGVTSGTVTYANTIGGSGAVNSGITTALVKSGAGTLALAANNTFTGDIIVNGGALAISSGANLGGANNQVFITSGATLAFTTNDLALASTHGIALSGPASIDVASGLTVSILGAISDGVLAGNLIKTGAGTLTLSSLKTYTGSTTVNGGTLLAGAANVLIPTSLVMVNAGGTLDLGGFVETVDNVNLAGGTITNGTLTSSGGIQSTGGTINGIAGTTALTITNGTTILLGNNTFSGPVDIHIGAAGGTLQVGNGGTSGTLGTGAVLNVGTLQFNRSDALTVGNIISSTGTVKQLGSGTTILTGANTYTGQTVIAAGTLQVGNGGTVGALGTGSVSNAGKLVFNRSNAITVANVISGTGSVTQAGTGTLTLSGVNTYTGGTLVSSGAIAVQNARALGTGALTMKPNTQLIIDGNGFNIANAVVFAAAGDPTITVGTGLTDTISGVISGPGSLTVNGGGTLVLTATNTYTGPTVVSASNLVVNGAIASASTISLTNGATLSGSGSIGTLNVASGTTLSAGSGVPGATMTVNGNLVFAAGSTYKVFASTTTASSIQVTGTATLTGAGVVANLASGTYLVHKYKIVGAAGGLGGTTFAGLTTTGVGPGVQTSLSYDASGAYLNISGLLNGGASTGLPTNQQAVTNAINAYFNSGGAVPTTYLPFSALTTADLTTAMATLSGELATAIPTVARRDTRTFLAAMLDPFVAGRSQACAAAGQPGTDGDDICTAPGHTVWATAFGGHERVDGAPATVGSHDLFANGMGAASGIDVRVGSALALGVAVTAGRDNWALASGLGTARSNYTGVGANATLDLGQGYLAAAIGLGWQHVNSSRSAFGTDVLAGGFHSHTFGGRIEAGMHLGMISPYAAFQGSRFTTPGFAETDSATGKFALNYAAQTYSDTSAEAGVRLDAAFAVRPGESLGIRLRGAYVRDWVDAPTVVASLASLPGAKFTITGAAPARESALLSSALEYHVGKGTFFTKFDGNFASGARSYQGSFGLRFNW